MAKNLQLNVRIDEDIRAKLEQIKEKLGYETDATTVRNAINLLHRQEFPKQREVAK